MTKRRLSDLYVVGKDLSFDDGAGEPVTVYLKKLTPVDQETAIRKANAARSKVYAAGRDPESDESGDLLSQAIDLGTRDDLVSYLCAARLSTFETQKEAELAAEDEWSKDGYLQGLKDAWEDGLKETYHVDPEDNEAKRVFAELERFAEQVEPHVADEKTNLEGLYANTPLEELRQLVADDLLSMSADVAWVREYRKCEVWLSVRVPENHRERYFESKDEVDELPPEILNRLVEEYRVLTVDVVEGKDSRATDGSLTSSVPPEPEAISQNSGLQVV